MGFSVSGDVGGQAVSALEALLTRQLEEAQAAEAKRANKAREAQASERLAFDKERFTADQDARQQDIEQESIDGLRKNTDRMDARLTRLQGEEDAMDVEARRKAVLDALPPQLRQMVELGVKPSSDDFQTPQQREEAGRLRVKQVGAEAEARAAAEAKYRTKPETGKQWITRGGETVFDVPQPGDVPRENTRTERPITGQERRTLGFFNRAKDADSIAAPLEEKIASMGLGGQMMLEHAPNFAQSQLGQSYRQAQRAFTEARLRQESGAAVPPAEYQNDAITYFAQPGDSPETIKQKQASRRQVLQSLGTSSGRAYEEFYGEKMVTDRPSPQPSHGGPSVGEERDINGVRAVWDGKGWLPK